jgi:DNA (cytosine-5)-methyltransferase 3A
VVSLFDGISCGRVALDRAGHTVFSFTAFEIDKYTKAISRYNYPDTQHHGDVLNADFRQYTNCDLLIGGSPCTFWSIAKNNREVDKNGIGWKLFMRYVEALRIMQPRFYVYENVKSMPQSIRDYITEELNCEPIMINSALVSAQQRKRLYWTNIKGIAQPQDKGILLRDILESGLSFMDKSYCVTATYAGASFEQTLRDKKRTTIAEPVPIALADKSQTILSTLYKENALSMLKRNKTGLFVAEQVDNASVLTDSIICKPVRIGSIGKGGQGNRVYSVHGKTVSITANGGGRGMETGLYKIDLPDGDYTIRKLTPIEAERCQTLPDNYTARGIDDNGNAVKISNTQRYKAIGNGFTVDVIAHILSHMKF